MTAFLLPRGTNANDGWRLWAEKWTALFAGRVDARQVVGGPVNALVPRRAPPLSSEDAGFPSLTFLDVIATC